MATKTSDESVTSDKDQLIADLQAAHVAFGAGTFSEAVALAHGINDRIALYSEVSRHNAPRRAEVSVIVVSHDSRNVLDQAFNAIARELNNISGELILVDNGNEALLATAKAQFGSFVYIKAPCNVGCSGGRNLGVHYASGAVVVFLDDDGLVEPNSIDALLTRMRLTGAAACRGRVSPLTAGPLPTHFDRGDSYVPSAIATEGISAWRRELFDKLSGFDILLAGHEGIKLCAEAYPFFGPFGFLYEPDAVLRHEVAKGSAAEEKRSRIDHNKKYLDLCVPRWRSIVAAIESVSSSSHRGLFEDWKALKRPIIRPSFRPVLSVLTTIRDWANSAEDYSIAWQLQSCGDFEIVLVSDRAPDLASKHLRQHWQNDPRLRIISSKSISRGSALNLAIARATTDLCMIANFEDVSNADRVALTLEHFARNPSADCASFFTYGESHAVTNPLTAHSTSQLSTQLLLGLPVAFPTLAFRKSSFPLPFSDTSDDNVERDWFIRNMAARQILGYTIPIPIVCCQERSEGPIPAIGSDLKGFESVLGHLTANDRECLGKLISRTPISSKRELKKVRQWLLDFYWHLGRNPNSFVEVEHYFADIYSQQAVEFSKLTQTRLLPLRGRIPFVAKALTYFRYVSRSLFFHIAFFRWLYTTEEAWRSPTNRPAKRVD